MTIALCLLTWNEVEGCKNDVPLIDKTKFDKVFCVDGGSNDGTVEYLQQNGIKVYSQTGKGLNQACKDAVSFCGCDAVIFFHPKGTVPVSDIYRFREYFEEGYELVIASRMMKDSLNEEDDKLIKPRKWFGMFLGLISAILFRREGNIVLDSLHGFRGVTTRAFREMKISNMSPSIDIELVSKSYKKKIKRIEFPTKEVARISGSTHFKALPVGWILLKYIFFELTGKINDK